MASYVVVVIDADGTLGVVGPFTGVLAEQRSEIVEKDIASRVNENVEVRAIMLEPWREYLDELIATNREG